MKKSFILYGNYEDQVNRLSDAQAGELLKIILHYVNTGEKIVSEDSMVDLVYSMIDFQLEYDMKRYAETCEKRREAGKKGGRPRKQETEEAAPEKPNALVENLCKTEKPDTDIETDTVTETDTDTKTETDTENAYDLKTSRRLLPSSCRSAGQQEEQCGFVYYGENRIPTTDAVLEQTEALARELFRTYWQKAPSRYDIERVFDYTYRLAETADGQTYAAASPEKADVLCHVFKQAALQGKLSWKYIDGIFDNYARRGVETLEEAEENEYRWNRGEIA